MNDLQCALDIGSARLFSQEKTGFKWSDGGLPCCRDLDSYSQVPSPHALNLEVISTERRINHGATYHYLQEGDTSSRRDGEVGYVSE